MLVVEMKDLFTRYANDVIATSAFGIACDSLNNPKNEFYEMGRDVTNFGGVRALIFFGYMLSPKLMKVRTSVLYPVLKRMCGEGSTNDQSPGPNCVAYAYLFVLLSSIIICQSNKLTLSDQAQVTPETESRSSNLV
jgi:hypothetical protein